MAAVVLSPLSLSGHPEPIIQELRFKRLFGDDDRINPERLDFVRQILNNQVAPLYGSQEETLKNISNSSGDFNTRLLYLGGKPVAVVVLKKKLINEYDYLGVKSSLTIRIFNLVDPRHLSSQKLQTELLEKALENAKDLDALSIHIRLSESSLETIKFFQSKNFSVVHTFERFSDSQTKECLLFRILKENAAKDYDSVKKEVEAKSRSLKSEKEKKEAEALVQHKRKGYTDPEPSKKIKNAPDEYYGGGGGGGGGAASGERADYTRDNGYRNHDESYSRNRSGSHASQVSHSRESNISFRNERESKAKDNSAPAKPFFLGKRVLQKAPDMTLQKFYLHMIQNGTKTVEGRLNRGAFANMRAGQTIRFFYKQNPSDDVNCDILSIIKYKSFKEMLEKEGFKSCVPNARSLEDAISIYDKIPGYSQGAAQNGVLALHVKKIPKT